MEYHSCIIPFLYYNKHFFVTRYMYDQYNIGTNSEGWAQTGWQTNFGQFVVHEVMFRNWRTTMNSHEFWCSSWWFWRAKNKILPKQLRAIENQTRLYQKQLRSNWSSQKAMESRKVGFLNSWVETSAFCSLKKEPVWPSMADWHISWWFGSWFNP